MAIFLRESDVESLATIKMALEAVESAFRMQGEQKCDNAPRRRCRMDQGLLHVMSASLPELGWAGLKSYTSAGSANQFLVLLYDTAGRPAAIMEADRLGRMRTGAATGIATKYMARKDASRLGLFGTGRQARCQLEAIRSVRPIQTVTVYSPDPENRKKFCAEMTKATGIEVRPASTAEEAAREMDIVTAITDSKIPVFQGGWLAPGTHINAAGGNFLSRQEIDVETVRRSACVIVDSLEQARLESGDLLRAAEAEAFYWEDARELGSVITGEFPGREDDSEITLFESQGIALADVAFAGKILEAALKAGIGQPLPF